MLTQAMHNQNAVLGTALQGVHTRHDVIMNNIANNDVPGFRARTVNFESALQQAVDNWRNTGELNLSRVRPNMHFQDAGMAFRVDDNNVDMEREMVQLFINSVRYETLVNSVLNNSRRLNAVITAR